MNDFMINRCPFSKIPHTKTGTFNNRFMLQTAIGIPAYSYSICDSRIASPEKPPGTIPIGLYTILTANAIIPVPMTNAGNSLHQNRFPNILASHPLDHPIQFNQKEDNLSLVILSYFKYLFHLIYYYIAQLSFEIYVHEHLFLRSVLSQSYDIDQPDVIFRSNAVSFFPVPSTD